MKLAQIGFGGIGRTVADSLSADPNSPYAAIAARPHQISDVHATLGKVPLVESAPDLLTQEPDLVIECASHGALRQYGEAVLEAGIDLIAVSVGILAEPEYRDRLLTAAAQSGARLIIPSGAIGGVDVVKAARHADLDSVTYTTRKAPALWRNTPAEEMVDLSAVSKPVLFFDDTAERAALLFAEKANVTATLALAGLGFEKTGVQFWADPDYPRSTHQIALTGTTGTMTIELANTVSPLDRKSSWLTAMSIVDAVRGRNATLRVG
jgi:aspartate dehydrogenase